MPLIECPYCQKQVSEAAAFCPNCGRPMKATRKLLIHGDEVIFTIEETGQAMSVPEGGKTDEPRPFLLATARRGGKTVWSGIVSWDVTSLRQLRELPEQELERLYRAKRLRTTIEEE